MFEVTLLGRSALLGVALETLQRRGWVDVLLDVGVFYGGLSCFPFCGIFGGRGMTYL